MPHQAPEVKNLRLMSLFEGKKEIAPGSFSGLPAQNQLRLSGSPEMVFPIIAINQGESLALLGISRLLPRFGPCSMPDAAKVFWLND